MTIDAYDRDPSAPYNVSEEDLIVGWDPALDDVLDEEDDDYQPNQNHGE